MKSFKIVAIALAAIILIATTGCTAPKTVTVTSGNPGVTQYLTTVTQVVPSGTVTNTVTQPAITNTVTLPPVTNTVIQPAVTTTVIEPAVTVTAPAVTVTTTTTITTTPPASIPAQVGIVTNIVQATSGLSAIPLVDGVNSIILALNITNTTSQTYAAVQFKVRLIMGNATTPKPTLTPLLGTSQTWYSLETSTVQVYDFYNHPSLTIEPNSSQTIYLTLAVNSTGAQSIIVSSAVA